MDKQIFDFRAPYIVEIIAPMRDGVAAGNSEPGNAAAGAADGSAPSACKKTAAMILSAASRNDCCTNSASLRLFIALESFGVSKQRDKNWDGGVAAANAADGVADLRGGGVFHITEANQLYAFRFQAEDARHRQGIRLFSARTDASPFNQMSKHRGRSFVEKAGAWNAQNGLPAPPPLRQRPFVGFGFGLFELRQRRQPLGFAF